MKLDSTLVLCITGGSLLSVAQVTAVRRQACTTADMLVQEQATGDVLFDKPLYVQLMHDDVVGFGWMCLTIPLYAAPVGGLQHMLRYVTLQPLADLSGNMHISAA